MKRWYVLQVYPGYEEVVLKDLLRQISRFGGDLFGQVLVPSAKLKSFFSLNDGGVSDERLFPGYILVEMEKNQESINLMTSTPKVVRFLGGKDPVALTEKEIGRILGQVRGEVAVASAVTDDFVEGSEIDIQKGPFAGFVGIIEKVDKENERLTIMVSIFGRLTPVELAFDQVKK